MPGQTHLVVLVPASRLEYSEAIASIAGSGGGRATIAAESETPPLGTAPNENSPDAPGSAGQAGHRSDPCA
jgi:hypothetical protein